MAYLFVFILLVVLVIIGGFYYYTGYLERTFNLTLKDSTNTQFISDKQWRFWKRVFYIALVLLVLILATQIIAWIPFQSVYHTMRIA